MDFNVSERLRRFFLFNETGSRIRDVFNTVVQAGKDTVNGFNHKEPVSWINGGILALCATSAVMSGGALIPTGFAVLMTASFWNHGRQERQAGSYPRYIR
jgi:hypothetical protein